MDKQQEPLETLREIRSLMERSSRFPSLSGLSGVIAGLAAIIGVWSGYRYLDLGWADPGYYRFATTESGEHNVDFYNFLLLDVGAVLLVSILATVVLTIRNAKIQGQPVWDATAQRLLINMMIPLVTGAVYCLSLFYHKRLALIAPTTIVFYGLALVNASRYTLNEIRYLGIAEIIVGLIAMTLVDFGLLFWAFGFGALHLIYGVTMYLKYGR